MVTGLGVPYNWIASYVAGDKIYCLHEAENKEAIYKHASEGGCPADLVTEVACELRPSTAGA